MEQIMNRLLDEFMLKMVDATRTCLMNTYEYNSYVRTYIQKCSCLLTNWKTRTQMRIDSMTSFANGCN